MIMAAFSLRAYRTVLLTTLLINSLVNAQGSVAGVGPIGLPTPTPLSTVDSASSSTVFSTDSIDATATTTPSTAVTGATTTTSDAAIPTSSGPLSIFVDLGTFLGDLSAGAQPMNLSDLTWQLGERKNISWTNSYQMTGKAVDLFLVQLLQNSSKMNSLRLLANFTGNSTSWTVDVHNLSTTSIPPVDPNMFQFQLCESGQQLPFVTSQNITIPDAQANETGTTPSPSQPTMTFTSPPSPGSSKLSTGAIVGIAVGAAVFVALLLLGLVHLICSKRRNKGPGGAAALERAMPAGFDPVEGPSSYRQVQMSQPENAGGAAATSAAASTVGLAVTSNRASATSGLAAPTSSRRDLWSPAPQIPPLLHLSSESQTNLSADPQPVPMSPSRPVSSLYSGGTLAEYEDEGATVGARRSVSLASSPSRHESDYLAPSPASPRPSSQLFSDQGARPWPLRDSALHGNPP